MSYTGTKHLGNLNHAPNNASSNNQQAAQFDRQVTLAANNAADDSAASQHSEGYVDHSEVTGNGTVIKILPDDNKAGGDNGSRHQRFILRLPSGQTVLIVHNIDVAPRVELLSEGDTVVFKGVYISNNQGGLIHWTHRDPNGRHEDGWLKRNGKIYQ
ncbi:MAG: DUF3465 domain-containing protein [Gammaproteobacteria bacterium]|nr:DUF3465 domain-containing protein [Gammaproteobacteria bacterium]